MAGPSPQHRNDLIIITSGLVKVLRGGDNAQRVKAFLGDMERFVVFRDNKAFWGSVQWGKARASSGMLLMNKARESVLFFLL